MTSDFSLAKIGGSAETADLVFVHGLTGDMIATWTSPGAEKNIGSYWPKWLSQDLPQLDVYALNFPTYVLESWAKREMALYERGKASLDYLASFGIGSRPLAFITHSLGGLLVKQMIRTGIEASDKGWRGVAENTRLIIFLATPHTGSSVASVFVFCLPRLGSPMVKLLQSENSELDQLNSAYRRLAPKLGIKTVVYYETHRTKRMTSLVTRTDADPGVVNTEIVPADADHIGICKPTSRYHPVYTGIHRHVSEFLKKAATPVVAVTQNPRHPVETQKITAGSVYGKQVAKDIYIVLPFDGNTIFGVPIRFRVSNFSDKSVKDVHLHVEMSNAFYFHKLNRRTDKIAAARKVKVFTDQGKTEHIARVLYSIPSIPPRSRFDIEDFIFADRPTVVPVETNAVSKDGIPMVIQSKIIFSLPISLTLDGEDVLPWTSVIEIHFRKGEILNFAAIERSESLLIAEIAQSGANKTKTTDVTFIGFAKLSPDPEGDADLRYAELASIVGINARLTPKRVEIRGKVEDL